MHGTVVSNGKGVAVFNKATIRNVQKIIVDFILDNEIAIIVVLLQYANFNSNDH